MIGSRLADIWLRMQASYWFIPGLMSGGAVVAAVVLVQVDYLFGDTMFDGVRWLRVNQAEGARAVLSTVAGSMITVAGVTFSMTLLAVSHATSQIGAQLLAAFMRDRGNQLTLGTFIATFLYCLMVLRSVRSADQSDPGVSPAEFVPHLAANGALVLAMMSVVVLIYFIHHVPQSINVANVVARVGNDLIASIHSMYPDDLGSSPPPNRPPAIADRTKSPEQTIVIRQSAGYLRVIDNETLMAEARRAGLVLELCKRPGDFGIAGEPLILIRSGDDIDDEVSHRLEGCFSWGNERTPNQDVLLPVRQLLEITGHALSPGINNQYTAMLCIDQLGRGLSEMLSRTVPDPERADQDGIVRVIAEPVDHEMFLAAVCGPLHQYVADDTIARRHVAGVLNRLACLPGNGHCREKISRFVARFEDAGDSV